MTRSVIRTAEDRPVRETVKSESVPIRTAKVYEEVARQIRCQILRSLRPGDMLPPERELAETLGVARSSVRDAIRSLELQDLVEPRSGAGTVVRETCKVWLFNRLDNRLVEKQQLLGEILGFRKMVEPTLAAEAAVHASETAISMLEKCLYRQEEKIDQGEIAVQEDCEFHYRIAMASGNNFVPRVLDMLMDLSKPASIPLQVGGRPQKSLAGHQRILVAIKRHDAEATYGAMLRHVQDVEKIVRTSFQ